MGAQAARSEIRHATTVAVAGRGLMIEGPSGSGKSALALELMAFGAELVADDRTRVRRDGTGLWAEAPETLPALIEARFFGLIGARLCGPVPLAAVVRLDLTETERLPPRRRCAVLGQELDLFHRPARGSFTAALLQYLKGPGLREPS